MKLLFNVMFCLVLMLSSVAQSQAQGKSKSASRHTIARGENLSVVARKYGVSLAELQKANPDLKGTLSVGQEVKLPAGSNAKAQPAAINLPVSNSVVKMGKPATSNPVKAKPVTALEKPVSGTYQVQPGETLLGIANRNTTTVEELQKANKLSGTSLKVGQKLIIPGKKGIAVTKPAPAQKLTVTAAQVPAISKTIPQETKPAQPASTTVLNTQMNGPGRDELSYFSGARTLANGKRAVRETGLATLIEGRLRTGKMLALHRTAPIGSTLQVRNSMTGQLVNVRVIGKLPDIGMNDKVVVKLSRKAYEKLGAGDRRSLVEVNSI